MLGELNAAHAACAAGLVNPVSAFAIAAVDVFSAEGVSLATSACCWTDCRDPPSCWRVVIPPAKLVAAAVPVVAFDRIWSQALFTVDSLDPAKPDIAVTALTFAP